MIIATSCYLVCFVDQSYAAEKAIHELHEITRVGNKVTVTKQKARDAVNNGPRLFRYVDLP